MKKAAIISGFLTIILSALSFTGILHFQDTVQAAVRAGNRLYSSGDYPGALEAYKKGLEVDPMDHNLNYNSGQAAYRMGDYQQAAAFYTNAPDSLDKYINQGDSYLRLGDNASDATQKTQSYQQALETFKQGILKYPENVDLKYNYEYVKNKLDQSNNQDQQDNQNQDQQNQDQQNQDQQGQDQSQGQDQQGQDQENQDQQGQNQQGQNQQGQDQQGQDQQGKNQQGQDQQGQDQQNQDQKGDQNSSTVDGADSAQATQADSEISQALAMLEQQEEESLKNNQEVNGQAKGDEGNGW